MAASLLRDQDALHSLGALTILNVNRPIHYLIKVDYEVTERAHTLDYARL